MHPSDQTASAPVSIETPRLALRKISVADAAAMFAVYGDAEGMLWVGDGKPLTFADCERWVEVTHRNYATRGYGMFAVALAATEITVGFCGLVHPENQVLPELKYAYRRAYWGRGYATEAAAALLAYGARKFRLTEVVATAAPEHTASHQVLIKIGMQRAPERRNEDGSFTEVFSWHPRSGKNAP